MEQGSGGRREGQKGFSRVNSRSNSEGGMRCEWSVGAKGALVPSSANGQAGAGLDAKTGKPRIRNFSHVGHSRTLRMSRCVVQGR